METPTQSGREPLSGQNGDVKKGEPYDAGNAQSSSNLSTGNNTSSNNVNGDSSSDNQPIGTTGAPGNTSSTGPIRPEHDTDKTGVTSAHQPTSATASDKPTSANDNSGAGAAPSIGAQPSSGAQNTQKQQGADRPHEEPDHGENQAIKDTKRDAEEAQAGVDTSGAGPQSLDEKDKGAAGSSSGGDDDGPQKKSTGEGTGEKYIKSSGMQADGGDFDAAKAGAGREAYRLLEEKGVHHEAGATASPDDDKEDGGADKEGKPSVGEKIKSKLHKH